MIDNFHILYLISFSVTRTNHKRESIQKFLNFSLNNSSDSSLMCLFIARDMNHRVLQDESFCVETNDNFLALWPITKNTK